MTTFALKLTDLLTEKLKPRLYGVFTLYWKLDEGIPILRIEFSYPAYFKKELKDIELLATINMLENIVLSEFDLVQLQIDALLKNTILI